MILKKQDITTLPLHELVDCDVAEVNLWCEQHYLHNHHAWLLPQMVAHYGTWRVVYNDNVIDVTKTLKHNIVTSWDRGLWKLTRAKRSQLIQRQVLSPDYASLTPIILMGLKRMQGIHYESWRGLDGLQYVIEAPLLEAIELVDYTCCDLGSDRLLEIRELGLLTKEGKTKGTKKSPESTWSLSGIKDTELGHLPKLTQTMLTQCWLANPKHRTPYMILDPQNWDRMPPPLISGEIFIKPRIETASKPKSLKASLPF